ncbi:MAG: hypothetical protein U0795_08355 [Pirellulales bacterium]
MKSSRLTVAGLAWSVLAAMASAHPGHLLDDAALDVTHRVGSAHHWLEAVLVTTVALLAAGWLARRACRRSSLAPTTADAHRS